MSSPVQYSLRRKTRGVHALHAGLQTREHVYGRRFRVAILREGRSCTHVVCPPGIRRAAGGFSTCVVAMHGEKVGVTCTTRYRILAVHMRPLFQTTSVMWQPLKSIARTGKQAGKNAGICSSPSGERQQYMIRLSANLMVALASLSRSMHHQSTPPLPGPNTQVRLQWRSTATTARERCMARMDGLACHASISRPPLQPRTTTRAGAGFSTQ